MASNTGEKQALRYNRILFYGSFILAGVSALLAVVFAGWTVYNLTQAFPIPSSTLSDVRVPNFLPRVVPPGLSTGFVYGARFFWKKAAECRQAAFEIWDRQRVEERHTKEVRLALSTASAATKADAALLPARVPSRSKEIANQKSAE